MQRSLAASCARGDDGGAAEGQRGMAWVARGAGGRLVGRPPPPPPPRRSPPPAWSLTRLGTGGVRAGAGAGEWGNGGPHGRPVGRGRGRHRTTGHHAWCETGHHASATHGGALTRRGAHHTRRLRAPVQTQPTPAARGRLGQTAGRADPRPREGGVPAAVLAAPGRAAGRRVCSRRAPARGWRAGQTTRPPRAATPAAAAATRRAAAPPRG